MLQNLILRRTCSRVYMTDSRLSAAQKKLIDRFSDTKDGKRIIEMYLKETEKKTVEDLTLQEASRLITRIKDGRIQAPPTKTSPTVKQATLIRSLQDGDERIRITADYLRKTGITTTICYRILTRKRSTGSTEKQYSLRGWVSFQMPMICSSYRQPLR